MKIGRAGQCRRWFKELILKSIPQHHAQSRRNALVAGLVPRWLRFFVALLTWLSSIPCFADDPTLHLEPADKEITVAGRPGSDQSLTQRITVVASGAIPEVLFRPSDLRTADGKHTIARSQLQVASVDALKNLLENTPRDLDIKVSGIKDPGEYSGVIDLVLPKHGVTAALHLPLKLHVDETPKLSIRKGSETIKIQLVNCTWLWCFYKKDHSADLQEDFSFPLDNGSVLPLKLSAVAASASGDVHRRSTGDALSITTPIEIPPIPICSIPFKIASNQLPPDHYLGDFQLRLPGKDDPLKIPLELNIRDAPLMPVTVLIFGILLGRFIKYMKEKGTPQSELLHKFLLLQARAIQNPDDLSLLEEPLRQARTYIDGLNLDAAKAALTVIENRLTVLVRLRSLEALLSPRSTDPGVAEILANIAKVRNQISLGADPTTTANQIEQQVQNLAPPAGPANAPARALEQVAASSVRAVAPFVVAGSAPVPVGKLRVWVARLTGHSEVLRADVTLWFLRPLAWLILVALLVLTGFMQLYMKNPIFGADFWGDYFALIVWAAGADVAGRTLSNFKG